MPYGGQEQQLRGWSKKKLEYLRSYIVAYCKATTKSLKRFYIDGFAGPGKLPDEDSGEMVDGSPLIALKAEPRFTLCHFVEKDKATCEKLRNNTRGYDNARIWEGDCNEWIPMILQTISRASPTLAVLDPTGVIGQVKWATIRTIAQWKTEIILNLPYHMAVRRLLPNDPSLLSPDRATQLGEYLPPGWQAVYCDTARGRRNLLCRKLLELYRDQLKSLGYTDVFASAVFRTEHSLPLYYLIWACKHPVGVRIARHVFLEQFDPRVRLLDVDDDEWLAF